MINFEEYKIRQAIPDDVLGLHQVYFITWLDTYPNKEFNITKEDIIFKYESRLTPDKIAERRIKISQIKDTELMLVIEKDNKIIALCNVVQEESYNQLKAIYVLPEYQRLGLGQVLWKEAQKVFSPKKDIIVHVAVYNEKGINFYKKLGFVSTEKIFCDEKYKMRNGAIIPELEMIIRISK